MFQTFFSCFLQSSREKAPKRPQGTGSPFHGRLGYGIYFPIIMKKGEFVTGVLNIKGLCLAFCYLPTICLQNHLPTILPKMRAVSFCIASVSCV